MTDDTKEREIANASGTDITYMIEMRAAGDPFNWGKRIIDKEWIRVPYETFDADRDGVPGPVYMRVKPFGLTYEGAMAMAWWAHAAAKGHRDRIDVRLVEVTTQWTTKDTLTGVTQEIPSPGPNAIAGISREDDK